MVRYMRTFLFVVGALLFAYNGGGILLADNCDSVSFDGQGGRVATAVCYSDGSGALPAWLAGIGMLVIAALFAFIALRRFATY